MTSLSVHLSCFQGVSSLFLMTECIPVSRWTSYPSFLYWWAFWLMLCFGCYGGSAVKHPPAVRETQVWFLGWQHPLEEGMATRSRILAWRIPCTEEPGGLYSPQGLEKVRRDWATNTFTFAVLNIVNSAALNIGEQVSSQIMIFSGSEARVGLARVSGNSAFSGLRISILLSFVTWPARWHPCPQCRRIPSSQQHLLFASLLEDGHSALCEGAGACSFDWHSSDSDAEHLLCALRPLDAFFREMFIYIFGIIFCWVGFFFFFILFIELYELPACFLDKFWVFIFVANCFFPMPRVAFLFFRVFLAGQ